MGFYHNVFFKSWLVRAFNVRGAEFQSNVVARMIEAPTQAEAEEKMRSYLSAENFAFGRVEASLG